MKLRKISCKYLKVFIYIYDLPCFAIWYDFYPAICVFSIPKPSHDVIWFYPMSCVFSIPELKSWEILFITYLSPNTCFVYFLLWVAWHGNTQCDDQNLSHISIITLISRKICDKRGYYLFARMFQRWINLYIMTFNHAK
jgi:hypothetical protein